jgi:hypothetical protein
MAGDEAMTGIVLSHITFALLLFLLLPTGKLPLNGRIAALAGAAILVMLTVDGLSLAEYVYSLTSGLSITAVLWLAWSAGAKVGGLRAMSERRHLQLAICFGALTLLLYPATLGLSMFDPYRLGYNPNYLLGFIFAISVVLWIVRHYFGAALITAATAVFMLDFRSPENYWDYLIDPLLGIYCLAIVGWYLLRRVWRKLKSRYDWTPSGGRWQNRPAFESPGERLMTSMTNLCAEDGIANTEKHLCRSLATGLAEDAGLPPHLPHRTL